MRTKQAGKGRTVEALGVGLHHFEATAAVGSETAGGRQQSGDFKIYQGDVAAEAEEPFEQEASLGKQRQDNREFKEAMAHYEKCLKMKQAPYGMVGFVYCNIGKCYMGLEMCDRALQYFQLYLELGMNVQDPEMQALAVSNMGLAQYALGNIQEAMDHHKRALDLGLELNDLKVQLQAFANLGNTYGATGRYKEAVVYHEQQLRLAYSMGDREAEARACFNLENDHNSLKHYAVAEQYRTKKLAARVSRVPLNSGFGDQKPGLPLHSGWLIKHEGGDIEGPSSCSAVKRWCILKGGVFSYQKHVRSGLKAQRYIRMADVVSIEEVVLEKFDSEQRSPAQDKSFRILCVDRAFYFTCATALECREWIEVLQQARTEIDQFGTMRKSLGSKTFLATNRKKTYNNPNHEAQRIPLSGKYNALVPEAHANSLDGKTVQNPMFGREESPGSIFSSGFQFLLTKSADNLLHEHENEDATDADEVTSGKEEDAKDVQSQRRHAPRVGFADYEHPADYGLMQAWRQQYVAADIQPLDVVAYCTLLLGSATIIVPGETQRLPRTQEVRDAFEELKRSPRELYRSQQLIMSIQEATVVIQTRVLAQSMDRPREVLRHPIQHILNVITFDRHMCFLEQQDAGRFKCYMYEMEENNKAEECKSLISARIRSNVPAASKYAAASPVSPESLSDKLPLSVHDYDVPVQAQFIGVYDTVPHYTTILKENIAAACSVVDGVTLSIETTESQVDGINLQSTWTNYGTSLHTSGQAAGESNESNVDGVDLQQESFESQIDGVHLHTSWTDYAAVIRTSTTVDYVDDDAGPLNNSTNQAFQLTQESAMKDNSQTDRWVSEEDEDEDPNSTASKSAHTRPRASNQNQVIPAPPDSNALLVMVRRQSASEETNQVPHALQAVHSTAALTFKSETLEADAAVGAQQQQEQQQHHQQQQQEEDNKDKTLPSDHVTEECSNAEDENLTGAADEDNGLLIQVGMNEDTFNVDHDYGLPVNEKGGDTIAVDDIDRPTNSLDDPTYEDDYGLPPNPLEDFNDNMDALTTEDQQDYHLPVFETRDLLQEVDAAESEARRLMQEAETAARQLLMLDDDDDDDC